MAIMKSNMKIKVCGMRDRENIQELAQLSLDYIGFYPHVGIALATSIAAWINIYLLASGLKSRKRFIIDERLRQNGARIIISSFLMGAALLICRHFLEGFMDRGEIFKIPSLVILQGMVPTLTAMEVFGFEPNNRTCTRLI